MKKTLIITAAFAVFVAASHAAFQVLNLDGSASFDTGDYEFLTGDSSYGNYDQRVDEPEGQTFTTTNAFDLGAISIIYEADGAPVSNVTLYVSEVDDPLTNSYVMPPAPAATLFSATFDVPPSSGGDDTLYIYLGTNISLAADSSYMISFDMIAASSVDFWWRRSGSTAGDFYPGGQRTVSGSADDDKDYLLGLGLTPPPTANDDEYTLPSGAISTNIAAPGVLANDLRYDSAVLVSNISSGSLTFNADGSFSCTNLVNGYNTFSYAVVKDAETSTPATVSLLVTLTEDPPDAVDNTYSMDLGFGDHIEGNVLNNDTNNSLLYAMSAMLEDPVSSGMLSITNDGSFFYTPNGGFSGTDSFTYRAYTPLSTSEVATVTLNVESNALPGVLIDSFETYDNSDETYVRDMPDASLNYDTFGSGLTRILDAGGNGPNYQYMRIGYDSGYRGAISKAGFFSGIPDSSTEYWLYCEMYVTHQSADANFGVTANATTVVSSSERGEFAAGVRFSGDGSGTLDLYAFTGGGDTNDVLLATGFEQDTWYGIWLDINNAANTYDVYIGDTGDASNRGTQVGTNIAYTSVGDLVALLLSSERNAFLDNIMQVDPDSFFINLPANIYGNGVAAFDTMQLSIALNDRANPADYWPASSEDLFTAPLHVAHSDAPDGTFAVTNLNLAGGDATNKVIYVKTADTVEFFHIINNE